MTRAGCLLAAIVLLAGVTAVSCRGRAASSLAPAAGYSGLYISLGDSIAAGNGASDRRTTSFVALLARDAGGLPVLQLARAGATTRDVLDAQLPRALDALRHQKVAFITLSAGGNDLAALIPNAACVQEPLPAACPLDASLATVERNLDAIVSRLRAANADAPIVLLAYPDFFSGTYHPFEAPAARVLPRLDDVIRRVASRYPHTAVADAAPAFEGRGATLTHVLDATSDPHPDDAGHRAIADAFEAVLKTLGAGR